MFMQSERIKKLPPYLFAEIDRLKNEMNNKGMDIIDLGIGDPDMPTPCAIIDIAKEALYNPHNHRYPSYKGLYEFREAVASWYKKRFNVNLDPNTEVVSLIGSKEGIAHLPLAFVNSGDYVLVPDPSYPVYSTSTVFADGINYAMPLREENEFLPDVDSIPPDILNKTKIMFINYPNNPTAAIVKENFYKKIINLAEKFNFIIASDNAYSEIYYDTNKPLSFLEVEGAKNVGIEFHSLSKTFNMTGWRIGFAVGNSNIITGLSKVKTNIDSGIFQTIQYAGIHALNNAEALNKPIREIFQKRRDEMTEALSTAGFDFKIPQATFYFWVRVPKDYKSSDFAKKLLQENGIVITPGVGFGRFGDEYFRISITNPRIKEAAERLKNVV